MHPTLFSYCIPYDDGVAPNSSSEWHLVATEPNRGKLQLLNKLLPANFLRGFFGGIILSAEGSDQREIGQFKYVPVGSSPLPPLAAMKGRTLVSVEGDIWSDSRETSLGEDTVCMFG